MSKKLLFRLDDICPGVNRENFQKIEVIFEKYNIKPLLGVVPDNKDPHLVVDELDESGFWKKINELCDDGWPIAQHGFTHIYCTEDSGIWQVNPFSEFAGVDYETQNEKIEAGKDILKSHGIVPEFFMAPGHTVDINTLKALKNNGFHYVTDGYADCVYSRDGLVMIPCTLSGVGMPAGTDTVCIHLNGWKQSDFDELDNFLSANSNICASWDDIVRETAIPKYGPAIASKEKKYIRIRNIKRKMAEDEKIQNYLRKSNSSNKLIKLIKRGLFLPMLLLKAKNASDR